jgi:hypothetical protein
LIGSRSTATSSRGWLGNALLLLRPDEPKLSLALVAYETDTTAIPCIHRRARRALENRGRAIRATVKNRHVHPWSRNAPSALLFSRRGCPRWES